MKRLIVFLAVICLLISGCGKKKDDVVVLNFLFWGIGSEEDLIMDNIAEFEKAHPNIKIQCENTPWARMLDKLMISTAGGRPPDVSRVSSEWFTPLAAKGVLMPLDEFIERDNFDIGDYYKHIMNGWGRYKGVTYSLPTDCDVTALYYNKTLFDELGVPYPDENLTYEGYIEMCKKFCADTNGDGKIDRWGGLVGPGSWSTYAHAYGGEFLSEDNTRCVIDSPGAMQGLQVLVDMLLKHHCVPASEDTMNVGGEKLFENGKIATYTTGAWAADIWFSKEIKNFEWDVAPLPKGSAGRPPWLAGTCYAVLNRSKHKEEAWTFIQWMSGTECQKKGAERNLFIPARRSAADAFLAVTRKPASKHVFIDPLAQEIPGWGCPKVSCAPEITGMMNSAMEKVFVGAEPLDKAIKEVIPLIDKSLRNETESNK